MVNLGGNKAPKNGAPCGAESLTEASAVEKPPIAILDQLVKKP
jgi:hypothetical protein